MTNRTRIYTALLAAGFAFSSVGAIAKNERAESNVERLQRQAEEAGQRAAAGTVDPSEIENIKRRRIMNGKPGLQYYVVLLSRSGQPIDYFVTDGKCSSSTKRLTPTHRLIDTGPNSLVVKAPSEDGTFGHSSPYIYCKTVDGKYKQWNGRYYASDRPIELSIKPLIIETSGKIGRQQ